MEETNSGPLGGDLIRNWLESAEYDMETAEAMFRSGRYIYTVFMSHLAIEKALKARVQKETGRTPPRTHSLRYLLRMSGLEPPPDTLDFLSKLSDLSVPTRYPEDFAALAENYDSQVAKDYLDKAKEAFEWIKRYLLL